MNATELLNDERRQANRGMTQRGAIAGLLIAFFLLFAAGDPAPASGMQQTKAAQRGVPQAALWKEPTDIRTRDLFYGPGGRERQPKSPFIFLKEDKSGTKPKFWVEDGRGVRWKVKLGDEAQPETAATRLIWAVGYFADEDYYLPKIKVEKLPRLRRGSKYVSTGGVVRGARFERDEKEDKKIGEWDWFKNPFAGTRELNGLRVMMALINNWDAKSVNNAVRARQGVEQAYYVSDVGSTFGRSGGIFKRTRNDVKGYVRSDFVRKVKADRVDFAIKTRPEFFLIVYPPYYIQRTRLEKITRDIPRADARWIGELLGRLSPQQIADAFRAAGFTPEQTSAYSRSIRERIGELEEL